MDCGAELYECLGSEEGSKLLLMKRLMNYHEKSLVLIAYP